jgi:RNA polymerase sigma factor (sigma-70 family)
VVPIDPLLAQPRADRAERLLEDLYRQHQRRLRGLAASAMLDWSQADEVVHDAFAGLAGRVDEVDNPEGYLQRSVINLALRVVKRRGRTVPARPIEPPSIPEIDEMWSIVATLPARQRAVLVLRFWEDLTQDQIADVLDIPLGTVKSALHRALRALKVELEAQEEP